MIPRYRLLLTTRLSIWPKPQHLCLHRSDPTTHTLMAESNIHVTRLIVIQLTPRTHRPKCPTHFPCPVGSHPINTNYKVKAYAAVLPVANYLHWTLPITSFPGIRQCIFPHRSLKYRWFFTIDLARLIIKVEIILQSYSWPRTPL